jgi:hypothetical protein
MTNKFQLLDLVTLIKDMPDRKLQRGAVGTVLEVFERNDHIAYEIEFVDDEGNFRETFAVAGNVLVAASDAQRLVHSILDLIRNMPPQRLQSIYDYTRFVATEAR